LYIKTWTPCTLGCVFTIVTIVNNIFYLYFVIINIHFFYLRTSQEADRRQQQIYNLISRH